MKHFSKYFVVIVMKQIFSILLSFILLSSQMYLTIGTHFCGGKAVELKILFGETHLGCEMPVMQESCNDSEKNNNDGTSFDKLPCCENKYQTVQVTNEFLKDAAQPSYNVDLAVVYFYTTLNLNLFQKSNHQFYTEYISPPLEKNIQVLFQTFLI